MSCLHPITIVNRRYADMTTLELRRYCEEHLVKGETYFVHRLTDQPQSYNDTSYFTEYVPIDYSITVPCGHCVGCQKTIRYAWTGRIHSEILASYKQGYIPLFITLTFRPERYKSDTVYQLAEFRKYIDKLRKRVGTKFRYVVVTDLSEKARVHLHAIVFNYSRNMIEYSPLHQAWTNGFSWIVPCKVEHAGYICKYVMKPGVRLLPGYERPADYRQKILTSNGVGFTYFQANDIEITLTGHAPDRFLVLGNKRYPIHPYVWRNLLTDDQRLTLRRQRACNPPVMRVGNKEYHDVSVFLEAFHNHVKELERKNPESFKAYEAWLHGRVSNNILTLTQQDFKFIQDQSRLGEDNNEIATAFDIIDCVTSFYENHPLSLQKALDNETFCFRDVWARGLREGPALDPQLEHNALPYNARGTGSSFLPQSDLPPRQIFDQASHLGLELSHDS